MDEPPNSTRSLAIPGPLAQVDPLEREASDGAMTSWKHKPRDTVANLFPARSIGPGDAYTQASNQRICSRSAINPGPTGFQASIAPVLNALLGDSKKVFEASYAQVWDAIRALVRNAINSGDIRKDLDPIDLLRALIGVANVAASPDWQQSARRLVDILIMGSRPIK